MSRLPTKPCGKPTRRCWINLAPSCGECLCADSLRAVLPTCMYLVYRWKSSSTPFILSNLFVLYNIFRLQTSSAVMWFHMNEKRRTECGAAYSALHHLSFIGCYTLADRESLLVVENSWRIIMVGWFCSVLYPACHTPSLMNLII